MDKEKLFELLNSTLWQDFKGFLRDEMSDYKKPFILTDIYFTVVFIIFSPFLILLYGHENEMYNVGVEVKEVECL